MDLKELNKTLKGLEAEKTTLKDLLEDEETINAKDKAIKEEDKKFLEKINNLEKEKQYIERLILEVKEEIKKAEDTCIKRYELIYIMTENVTGEQISEAQKEIESLIKYKNDIKIEHIGIKLLAYEVKGNKKGYFVRFEFNTDKMNLAEIEKYLRLNNNILKFISLKISDEE